MNRERGLYKEKLNNQEREAFIRKAMEGVRLDQDTWNDWTPMAFITAPFGADIETLTPLRRYRDGLKAIHTSKIEKLIMQLSESKAIVAYDKLVDEFNADLDRIKRTNDKVAAKEHADKARTLIYSQK